MKKNSVKYLQGFSLSQLTLSEKNEVKNLCLATPDLVMSQSSSSIMNRMRLYGSRPTVVVYDAARVE
jgi:hypothetical protein